MVALAIDPGAEESAYVVWDGHNVSEFRKEENSVILGRLKHMHPNDHPQIIIEQVRSYGMPVGANVFDTVHWSGRFHEAAGKAVLIPRKDVKMHMCGKANARDSNIIQALVDRFAYNKKNHGKGTKKDPGFFYGFHADIWQAFALAVTYHDNKSDYSEV